MEGNTTTAQPLNDGTTDVVNLALKNILTGIRDLIKAESLMVSEEKAEASGENEFNPFAHYNTQQELLGYTIGALGKILHVYQLESQFTEYIIDKMLPTSGDQVEGETKLDN